MQIEHNLTPDISLTFEVEHQTFTSGEYNDFMLSDGSEVEINDTNYSASDLPVWLSEWLTEYLEDETFYDEYEAYMTKLEIEEERYQRGRKIDDAIDERKRELRV